MASEVQQRERAMGRVNRAIDHGRAVWRAAEAFDGVLRTILVCGGATVAGFLLDNLIHLPATARLIYGVALVLLLVFMLGRLVFYPLLRPLTDEMVAAHLERGLPQLNNRVINAVLLYHERIRDALARQMIVSQLRDAAQWVSTRELPRPPEVRELWRPAFWVLCLVGAGMLYGLVFSNYFGNAFMRFVCPRREIPPITDTRFSVTPGHTRVLQGDSLTVEATVRGVLPELAHIDMKNAEAKREADTMAFEGSGFTYVFANVQKDFDYRVRGGDAATPWYTVTVQSRPAIESLSITYVYPEYTGLPEKTETGTGGDIRGPVDTLVRLQLTADRPVRQGSMEVEPLGEGEDALTETLRLSPVSGTEMRGELALQRSGRYTVRVIDAAGISNIPQVRHIEAVPDSAPRVHFVKPGRDVAVGPTGKVTLLASAEDDFSLRDLHLLVQSAAGAEWEKTASWQYDAGTCVAREGSILDVEQLGVPVGGVLAYYMQANDGLRRDGDDAGRSRIYHVRVTAGGAVDGADAEARKALRDLIGELIKLQKANLDATRSLGSTGRVEEDATRFRGRADALVATEEDIYGRASQAVVTYVGAEDSNMTEALGRIAAGPMSEAIDLLKDLREVAQTAGVEPGAGAAAEKEAEVVAFLEGLLEDPAAVLANLLQQEGKDEIVVESLEDLTDGEAMAERLLRAIEDFQTDQKRVIELSNQLAEKLVDDFTDEDEKKLQEIIDTEKKWTEFFQEAYTDLSKLPPQDHSLATQAKEFLEVFSEVQQAVEEAERKVIELAVPHEQAGLELAESIETNLEKWLMETKDNQLWSMEDPLEDYELPLVELPDELQDLIGDLVEEEEDMLEEFDDVTSGWSDSLDIGAGWDTMDGPISNMSAKGVTGNRLPNTQEIGGRSGEGRTGKSSGQFVEESATGKGGRQTPSRLTADPFESGWVDDTSAEAPTGSTGGGKVSGQGAEGFQGPVPPPLHQKLQRMAVQQRELIDSAKRLDFGLKKYRYPQGRLPETIELMEATAVGLEQGEVSTFGTYQRVVLSNLREVKELTDKQKQVGRDRSALLPKRLRDEIAAGQDEAVPDQYREMVSNYFRALSEAGTERK